MTFEEWKKSLYELGAKPFVGTVWSMFDDWKKDREELIEFYRKEFEKLRELEGLP